MERRKFITEVGQATAAICSIGFIASCSKSNDSSTPEPPGGGNAKLTANLNSELTSVGSSKVNGNIIVVRTATGNVASSFVALSLICTHQQCTVGYNAGNSDFECPCHGSKYSITGAVVQGPATAALTKYAITINNNTLSVN